MKRYLLMMLAITPLAVLAAQADVNHIFANPSHLQRDAVALTGSWAHDPASTVLFQEDQKVFFQLARNAAEKPGKAMKPDHESERAPCLGSMDSDDTSGDDEVQITQSGNGENGENGEKNGNGDEEDGNGDDDEKEEDEEDEGEGGWDRLWDAPKLG